MSFTSTLTGGLIADAPDYAAMAKKSEAKRKAIIDLGLQQINALYGGGTAPFYTMASSDPFSKGEWRSGGKDQVFYHQNKKGQFVPYYAPKLQREGRGLETGTMAGAGIGTAIMPGVGTVAGAALGGTIGALADGDVKGAMLSSGTGGAYGFMHKIFGMGDQPTQRQLVNKKLRRNLLFNAPTNQTFTGYGDPFFEARRKAYVDYAMPQLGEQYRNARDMQLYAMSNRGLLGSTQASRAASDLTRQTGVAQQTIADEAMNQSNQLRKAIEDARQASIQQLYQTADPAQAMMRALSVSQQFERPSAFVPIANMFNNALSQYSMMNQQRKYGAYPQLFSGEAMSNYLAPIE